MSKSANDIFDEMRESGAEVFFQYQCKHPFRVTWLEDEGDTDIIARLSRKLAKAKSENTKLRKYAQHGARCLQKDHLGPCSCGLSEVMNPKKQNPI